MSTIVRPARTLPSRPGSRFGGQLAALLALGSTGCIALVDRDTKQCRKDADCERAGEDFAGTVCTSEQVCGFEPCTKHADCRAHFGEGGYCPPSTGTCVDMFTERCAELLLPKGMDTISEGTVLIGFMGPLWPDESGSYGIPLRQGAQLALDQINESPARLPPAAGSQTPRHLAMLVCHDGDVPHAEEVARHLVEKVGVSAVVGPAFSGPTDAVVNNVMKPNQALSISPSATRPDFARWSDQDVFWRTVPSDSFQAPAMAALVASSAELLRASGELAADEQPRVALIWIDSSWGDGIQSEVDPLLRKLPITLSYVEYADSTSTPEGWGDIARAVTKQQPHIVVALGTNEFARELLPRIEELSSSQKPLYVVPEGSRVDELAALVGERPELGARILGTAPGPRKGDAYRDFEADFTGKYRQLEPGNLAEFAYDAVYLLGFAITRTRLEQPGGPALIAALKELSCHEPDREVLSASDYVASAQRAGSGACVDYEGASGPVDFDAHGEIVGASSDMQIWCPRKTGGEVELSRIQGVYYDAEAGKIQGTLALCAD